MKLLLVDDHTMVREGLRRVLASPWPAGSVVEAGSAEEALEALQREAFDMVITDLSMPGMGGLALVREVRGRHPGLPVLVLSMHAEAPFARRAFEAGARGYVAKDRSAEELVQAVRRVAEGGVYVSASVAEGLVARTLGAQAAQGAPAAPGAPGATPEAGGPGAARANGRAPQALSVREREVVQRLVDGQRLTDIAAAMQLSVKTVSSHKTRILAKLGLPSLAALIRHALDHPP